MPRAEAKTDFAEFLAKKGECVAYIEGVLREAGIDLSGPSEQAMDRVGEWLVSHARRVRIKRKNDLRFADAPSEQDISTPTMSACCYVGLMFGERMTLDVERTSWVLVTENKRDMDYHRAVVRSEGGYEQLEPIRVVMNFVRGRVADSSGRRLSDFYEIWKSLL